MDDFPRPFPSDELSAEDLAVIQAFDAMDDLVTTGLPDEHQPEPQNTTSPLAKGEDSEDMLMLFVGEVAEDIDLMRRALRQFEHDSSSRSPSLLALGYTAHKVKGTCGAMSCEAMATIALKIEEELHLIKAEQVTVLTGLMTLAHAINTLEATLQSVIEDGQENPLPMQELAGDLVLLHAEAEATQTSAKESLPQAAPALKFSSLSAAAQIDADALQTLMTHTEQLVELNPALQSAQAEVTQSLLELQAAHARLLRLEAHFSTLPFSETSVAEQERLPFEDRPASSLVARILHESLQRTGQQAQIRQRLVPLFVSPQGLAPEAALLNEMQIDRFTEQKILLQSFNEAVVDVATALAQLTAAFARLQTLIGQQGRQAMSVRADALRLRSTSFGVLLMRVQEVVQDLARSHRQPLAFEASGEGTEIDQDIVEVLAEPLLHLVNASVTDSLLSSPQHMGQEPRRIWLQAQSISNEIAIELGFSMPIPGGALEALHSPIQQLHGSITARRNLHGGVNYQLRFPRTQGVIQGLRVQAGGQGLVLPLTAIDSIDYARQETPAQVYSLASLLNFPPLSSALAAPLPPLILLAGSQKRMAIQVDEILSEVELIMKPLARHLQQPGLVGAAVDGAGDVLLIVDLPQLISSLLAQQHSPRLAAVTAPLGETRQPTSVLVADDSVSMRQSLRQTFERAGYEVIEARDGMEALEYLTDGRMPDVLMLDIEMPNLNGYDLLNILHVQPGFAHCKTILLTSRSSDAHRQRAMELGACAFLSKPCPQEVLLETVRKVLLGVEITGDPA